MDAGTDLSKVAASSPILPVTRLRVSSPAAGPDHARQQGAPGSGSPMGPEEVDDVGSSDDELELDDELERDGKPEPDDPLAPQPLGPDDEDAVTSIDDELELDEELELDDERELADIPDAPNALGPEEEDEVGSNEDELEVKDELELELELELDRELELTRLEAELCTTVFLLKKKRGQPRANDRGGATIPELDLRLEQTKQRLMARINEPPAG